MRCEKAQHSSEQSRRQAHESEDQACTQSQAQHVCIRRRYRNGSAIAVALPSRHMRLVQ